LLLQGALLWKWALSPPADPTDGLEVGLRDSTFLGVVAPAARAALSIARRASVPGCQAVRGPGRGCSHPLLSARTCNTCLNIRSCSGQSGCAAELVSLHARLRGGAELRS